MELNLTKEVLQTSEIVYEGNTEQPIDSDITLPDYCPDIQRILKCSLTPGITSTHVSGNRINADGNALLRILYVDENNKIRSYEINLPFSKYIENDEISQDTFSIVRSCTEYVNCRVVSPRKLDVHGSVTISFKVFAKLSSEYLSNAEGCGIQLKKREHEIVLLIGKVEKSFPLSEVLEIPDSKPPIQSIINISSNAIVNDIKCIKNKFLLKGELNILLIYCSGGEENEIETLRHSMPINQIVEMEGIDETCTYNACLDITSLEVLVKSDSSGEQRIIDINARICSVISAYKEQTLIVITDAYSVTNEIEKVEKNIETKNLVLNFSDSTLARSSVELNSLGIKSVVHAWYGDVTVNSSVNEDEYIVNGNITIGILGISTEGQVTYSERQIDYEHKHIMTTSANKIICNPNIQIIAFEFNQIGDKLDIKAEISIVADVVTSSFEKTIDEIIINENEQRGASLSALTIYFPDIGESIWNIARKYNTTVEAIMSENDLNDEIISEKIMLLIPAV